MTTLDQDMEIQETISDHHVFREGYKTAIRDALNVLDQAGPTAALYALKVRALLGDDRT